MPRARPSVLIASLLLAFAAGCVLRGDGSQFYMLSADASAPLTAHPVRVGLGPVSVPAYLDAPTIVTRVDPNRLEYARFDRWASPLSLQVARVLAADLGGTGSIAVVSYPWYPSTQVDVVVRVNLLAFENDPSGTAHLDATWSLVEPRSGVVRRSGRTTLDEPATARTTDGAVAALSRALAELARRIAEDLLVSPS
jgi:uncharacterized lipoprotein YmbA